MMKKILSMMLVCVMVVGMVTGCGSSDEQKTSSSTSDSGKKKLTAAANVDYAPLNFMRMENRLVLTLICGVQSVTN